MVFPERTALREAALRELAQGPPAALTPPPPRVPCVMGPVPSIIAADAPPYAVFFPTMAPPATPLPHPAAFPSTGGQQPTVLFRQPQCMDYASDDGGSRDDDGSDDDGSDDEGDDHGGTYGTTGYEPTPAPPPHPYASQQPCGSAVPAFSPPPLHVHGYGNGLSAGFSGDRGGGYRGNCGATRATSRCPRPRRTPPRTSRGAQRSSPPRLPSTRRRTRPAARAATAIAATNASAATARQATSPRLRLRRTSHSPRASSPPPPPHTQRAPPPPPTTSWVPRRRWRLRPRSSPPAGAAAPERGRTPPRAGRLPPSPRAGTAASTAAATRQGSLRASKATSRPSSPRRSTTRTGAAPNSWWPQPRCAPSVETS